MSASKPPAPKPRILTPQAAKERAGKGPAAPKPVHHVYESLSQSEVPAEGPRLAPKSRLSTLISGFRQRYASLPQPAQRAGRALRILAPLVPISIFFSEYVMQVMWVKGPSMTPYLNEDYDKMQTKSDMVLVSMWPWGRIWPWERTRRLERGMVVTFRSPANSSHVAIKRVVGLPGDRITTREPCMKPTQIVPFNHVWLEGDAADPRRSLDSNTYGPVSISLITGRVFAVLGPRRRWLDWTGWEAGKVDGAGPESPFGDNYRQGVRDRVLKEAVKLEQPSLD
ncbi:uncharacterized protein N7459_000230 [Penicillium hispanicum]|uniref:uncharacterized protein n=1 Tax=Penicillium hispanicum TaxID=1080232 RepID=UPI0025400D85|nr:uncharacterized protein N7459_000230 [Penicillium hispanicum]KAJ5594022.1 hypothetical protein N7459_000230 [Penicillium hispanicum]